MSFYSIIIVKFFVQLDLEKAEEPEIKLPTSIGLSKEQEFQKNIYFCFVDYTKAFDYVDHNKLWKILQEMGLPEHLTYPWEICVLVKKQQIEQEIENRLVPSWEKSASRLYIVTLLI